MHGRHRRIATFGLAALAVAAFAPAAHGATFCVGLPGVCSAGNHKATIEAAITSAQGTAVDDVVEIGPGTFTSVASSGFSVSGNGHGVLLRGRGRGTTILTSPAGILSNESVLYLTSDGASATELTVRVPNNAEVGVYGITARGPATHVAITAAPTSSYRYGINAYGTLNEDIDVDFSTVNSTSGIGASASDASAVISDVDVVTNGSGLSAQGGGTIRRARVEAGSQGGRVLQSSTIEDSIVRLKGNNAIGLDVFNQPNVGTAATINGVTVDGGGFSNVTGVRVRDNFSGAPTSATLDGFVASRVATPVHATHSSGTAANAFLVRSCVDAASNQAVNGAMVSVGPGTITPCAPGLRDPAAGDLRPRADSPVIDGGSPAAPSGPDALGAPRVLDGNGDGTARRDMGGAEFVPVAPALTAAGPATGTTGEQLAFTATASDPDPGDALTITWSFDDGATAQGDAAAHAFDTPGDHTATATVRDRAGLTKSATVTVSVVAPPPPPPGGGTTTPPPAADKTPPLLTAVSLTKAFRARVRGLLRLTSNEAGTLTLRVQRRKGRRWVNRRGSAVVPMKAGANRLRLGKALVAKLKPGRYRLVVVAADAAGNKAKPRRFVFRVRR